MLFYVVRRLAWTVVMLAVISLITFVIFLAIPNTAASRQGLVAPDLQTQWNLQGHSLEYQYVHFLDRVVVHGDLGHSLRQPLTVRYMLGRALPVTISLMIGGTIVCLLLAFPIGLLAALRPRSFLNRGLMIFILIGVSTHAVWLSLFFSYIFGAKLHWFPVAGYCDLRYHAVNAGTTGCGGPRYWAYHMVLPWVTFGLLFAAFYARMIRASVLEALDEDYVRTARAKGASERKVVQGHVLRNAMLPIVTMLGMDVAFAFVSVIFIETVFQLPGIGWTLYQALPSTDLPVIMGVTLVICTGAILGNLVADLAYCWVDPRVRLKSAPAGELQPVSPGRSVRARPRALAESAPES
ncbi:MAG: ABC transporter permease [Gaiellaceae bacterium]